MKSNFEEIAAAHNALETALGEETKNRQSGDNALSERINSEKSARESSEGILRQSIISESERLQGSILETAAQLRQGISSETTSRQNADAQLSAQLSAEAAARQNSDRNLQSGIDTLTAKAHTHENAAILSGISEEDVTAWRDKTNYDKDNGIMISYLLDMLIGQSRDMQELYKAAGVTLYDGGIFEDELYDSDDILDGGDFDTEGEPFDCNDYQPSAAVPAVLDGGQY